MSIQSHGNFPIPTSVKRAEMSKGETSMIINTGIRTDIINHYSEWLFNRFREGYVYTRNPLFPNRVNSYVLHPDKVDAVLFCSKNYAPALSRLHEITDRYHTYFHYTITAYGADIEPNIPPIPERIRTLTELSKLVGRERIMWRFTPIFETDRYPAQRILNTFDMLAERLAPHVSGCVFGFIEPFFSLRKRLPDVYPLNNERKLYFAERLAAIAAKHALPLQTCRTRNTYEQFGIARKGCYTLDAIGEANGCRFRNIRHTGIDRDCLCIASRDIGWYDSCPNLCRYCNANHSHTAVMENVRCHDAASPLLIGTLQENDELTEGIQTSYLCDERQLSIFDL